MDLERIVEAITPISAEVAADYAAEAARKSAQDSLEAQLLERVVAIVRPSILAISRRVRTSETWERSGGTINERHADAAWRAVAPLDHVASDTDCPPRERRTYEWAAEFYGHRLFLLPDGTWRELEYSGHRSNATQSGEWATKERVMTHLEVAREWEVADILEGLLAHLQRAQARIAHRTTENRAAKVAAALAAIA